MAHKTFGFTVDFNNKKRLAVANVKQNDSAVFNILLVEDGKPVDLTNQQIRLFINKPDNKLVVQDDNITVVDAKRGSIRINVKNSAFQAVGTAVAELDVWGTNQENASSQNFFIEVDEQLGSNDAVKSYVDVNLFRQLTEYIDTANANIAKYRAVMEAFTKAGISAQGLLDIKAYIDNNLAGLKAQGDRADNLIVQLNSKNSLADSLIKSLNNTISSGENKKQELINTTKQAEAKKQEVISVTNQAEAKKQDVINYTNKAEAKRAELANATATAEAKRVEVVNATNTGNNTKTALDKATATAEAKRVEVVNATNTAEAKRQLLQTAIQNASLDNYVKKTGDTLSNDLVFSGGATPLKILCDFETGWARGIEYHKNGTCVGAIGATGDGTKLNKAYMGTTATPWTGTNSFSVDKQGCYFDNKKIYHTGNKPTAEEVGAYPIPKSMVTDFNKTLTEGQYIISSECPNAPVSGTRYGILLVYVSTGTTHNNANNWIWQEYYDTNGNRYWRYKVNNSDWFPWRKDYNSGSKPTPEEIGTYSKDIIDKRTMILDTRGDNQNPNWYIQNYPQQTITEFKISKALLIPNADDTFGVLETKIPWKNNSGGYPVQTYRNYSFPIYQRHGISDTEWSPWEKIYTTGSKPTPAEIGALNKNGDTVYGNLYLSAGKVLVTANNYGIKGQLEDGSGSDYILYMARDNRIKISYNNRPVDIQAKDVTVNGVQVATDIQKNPLWTGCYFVTDTQTVTPSKPLSQCRGGWMLVWSDFSGKLNDTNCVYTYIPKYGYIPFPNETDMLIPISAFDAPIVKALRIADTYFTGYGSNSEGNKGNVALRAVYEY
ncbi:BppU family phage baseplate upper protein (plasmid) [Clostridium perfringens]|uniref:BppU family phage baseplate upper protein n=1 Tax=Clostridium perfringens TaxID=1502 RepID=UPI001CCE1690|nr:BppU family phage baseplate upper protein [Clostridium perfringens]UBK83429.1 BppU family phage baseplate upper protein [Clostridium perfringens]